MKSMKWHRSPTYTYTADALKGSRRISLQLAGLVVGMVQMRSLLWTRRAKICIPNHNKEFIALKIILISALVAHFLP